ncbi:hypothetical protein [Nocardia xishanensis]|uniref:Uncharacterized protein n=1 Tax=Nocardia xishanensis TaxID=238964 RepID=A0ABW7WYI9_9NOCA
MITGRAWRAIAPSGRCVAALGAGGVALNESRAAVLDEWRVAVLDEWRAGTWRVRRGAAA